MGGVSKTVTILPTHTHTHTVLVPIYASCDASTNNLYTTASKQNVVLKLWMTFCDVYIDSYIRLLLRSPPPPPRHILLHLSPPSLHLLLSNCSRNLSFTSITCRKLAEPKITSVLLQAFLYRPIFPVPFSLESLWPPPCLFLQCPSLVITSPHTQCQKQLLILTADEIRHIWIRLSQKQEIRSFSKLAHGLKLTYL